MAAAAAAANPKTAIPFSPHELCRSSTRFISCPWIPCPARPFLRNPIEPRNFRHSRGFRRYLGERASWRQWRRIFSRFRFLDSRSSAEWIQNSFHVFRRIYVVAIYIGLVSRRGDSVEVRNSRGDTDEIQSS